MFSKVICKETLEDVSAVSGMLAIHSSQLVMKFHGTLQN
jgi:hypothetical protein